MLNSHLKTHSFIHSFIYQHLHSQYWYFIWEWRIHSVTAAMGFPLQDKIMGGYPIIMKFTYFVRVNFQFSFPFTFKVSLQPFYPVKDIWFCCFFSVKQLCFPNTLALSSHDHSLSFYVWCWLPTTKNNKHF